ncbi:FHA domain-containing protein FHA2 [Zea mays]|jgi:hypothetical protein|uniref:FHA domain-containing protein FHA2 n=1 Tax=Zea mays TaxID=4577 RepID=A0A1D6KJT1_MAIZE|nr:FHA domain-containing protein FHA2 [Zea mays]
MQNVSRQHTQRLLHSSGRGGTATPLVVGRERIADGAEDVEAPRRRRDGLYSRGRESLLCRRRGLFSLSLLLFVKRKHQMEKKFIHKLHVEHKYSVKKSDHS